MPFGLFLVFTALVLLVVRAPDLFSLLGADPSVETDQTGSQRQVLLLLFGGILAAVTALLSWKRHEREQQALQIERDRHWTSRYTDAVSQLGDPSSTLNYGGLYALQRLAIETTEAKDAQMIANLLSAYIREHAYRGELPAVNADLHTPVPPTFLTDVFGTLSQVAAHHEIIGDFTGSYLENLDLSGTHLPGSIFSGCDLAGAMFPHADLNYSIFFDANMRGADLEGCMLVDSNLRNADLRGAILRETSLDGCDLEGADLSGADLRGTVFSGATGWGYGQLEAAARWDSTTIWPKGHHPSTPGKGPSGGVVTVIRDQ